MSKKQTDVGCDDFERAEYNRYIVANKLFREAYLLAESAVAHTPTNQPLAPWIPIGNLPMVGRKELRRNSGGEHIGWLEEETPITIPLVGEEDLTDLPGEVV